MDSKSVFSPDLPLRANRPDVLDEIFDGEAVLVNLHRGTYYALNASATEVWNALSPGRRPETAIGLLAARHATDRGAVGALITPFVAQLLEEGLLVAADEEGPEPDPLPAPKNELAAPELQRFDDMQDLLLLDPVHDIDLDGDGWPVKAGERVERQDLAVP